VKLKEIEEKMHLARVYKYVAQLELEKNKRKNGVYHDFTDVDDFYTHKIKEYDNTIQQLHHARINRMEKMFRVTAVGVHLAILLVVIKILI